MRSRVGSGTQMPWFGAPCGVPSSLSWPHIAPWRCGGPQCRNSCSQHRHRTPTWRSVCLLHLLFVLKKATEKSSSLLFERELHPKKKDVNYQRKFVGCAPQDGQTRDVCVCLASCGSKFSERPSREILLAEVRSNHVTLLRSVTASAATTQSDSKERCRERSLSDGWCFPFSGSCCMILFCGVCLDPI